MELALKCNPGLSDGGNKYGGQVPECVYAGSVGPILNETKCHLVSFSLVIN